MPIARLSGWSVCCWSMIGQFKALQSTFLSSIYVSNSCGLQVWLHILCFLMLSIVPPFHGELRFSYQLTDQASVHPASTCDVTLREMCDFLTYSLSTDIGLKLPHHMCCVGLFWLILGQCCAIQTDYKRLQHAADSEPFHKSGCDSSNRGEVKTQKWFIWIYEACYLWDLRS